MSGDSFTKRKLDWLDQVAADRGVSATAFKTAYIIATAFLNRQSNDAWPAQDKLAAKIGITPRALRDATGQLVERGHLAVTVSKGPGRSNHYRPILKYRKPASDIQQPEYRNAASSIEPRENRNHTSGITPGKPEATFLFPEVNTGSLASEYRKFDVENTGSQLPTNPFIEPIEEPSERYMPPIVDGSFDEFWRAYPRKKGKIAAEKAFAKVISKNLATADELIAGARRYAAERDGQEGRFTKYPAGWLNEGRWADEESGVDRPRAGAASAAFGIAAFVGETE